MNYKQKFKEDTFQKMQQNEVPPFQAKRIVPSAYIKPRKKFSPLKVASIVAASVVLVLLINVTAFLLIVGLKSEPSFRKLHKDYSLHDAALISNSSFKSLNNVTYPLTRGKDRDLEREYKTAVLSFADTFYQEAKLTDENFSYSPLSLYMNLDVLSLTSSNEALDLAFDTVLGVDSNARARNLKTVYNTNYFTNSAGTIQLYNGFFQTNDYPVNPAFPLELEKRYTESYQMDFAREEDIALLLLWIDQKLGATNFTNQTDLSINELTAFLAISTMYFNNTWASVFQTNATYVSDFNHLDHTKTKIEYMKHTYVGDFYEYDDYVSVYDYYANGMKIQYLTPKSSEDNILDLLGTKNFLVEDDLRYSGEKTIELHVPKFSIESLVDFTPILKRLGLGKAFDPGSTDMPFLGEPGTSLVETKQKNVIRFSEDGTEIKTLTWSGAPKSTAPLPNEGWQVKLDHPFVYVIYDALGLPLYMGNVTAP